MRFNTASVLIQRIFTSYERGIYEFQYSFCSYSTESGSGSAIADG